jgi:prepilin-type N-terminal cleavage/methylation domain-containing protein
MRRREAGMTLLEILIAMAIMVTMMALAWQTIGNTGEVKRKFEAFEERNHELRMAVGRIAADLEGAYLSKNEDQNATHPRTMFVSKSGSRFPDIHFSTLGHRVLWADANESEQTVISYLTRSDPERRNVTNLIRREQRRLSNDPPTEVPAEYDIVLRDIQALKLEFWNWKTLDWQDTWDTTQADGQRGWLPSRVRITVTIKDDNDKDYKLTTQARILMQEPVMAILP